VDLSIRIRPARRAAQDGHGDNRGGEHPAHESASFKTPDCGLLIIIGVNSGLTSACRSASLMI